MIVALTNMEDKDLALDFTMCLEHFRYAKPTTKEEEYKTPAESIDNSPMANDSESIEIVVTPSNTTAGGFNPMQSSCTETVSTNNTDICVLESHYAFKEENESNGEVESVRNGRVLLCSNEVAGNSCSIDAPDFTVLHVPQSQGRRVYNCDESTEVLMLVNSEYNGRPGQTCSQTDSDVEVLMSEEIIDSDWSAGGPVVSDDGFENGHGLKHVLEDVSTKKDEVSSTSGSLRQHEEQLQMQQQESTDQDVSVEEFNYNSTNSCQQLNRSQLLSIIHDQESRIQSLELTLERYRAAQQKLFEHVDALRLELCQIQMPSASSSVEAVEQHES